MIEAMTNGGWKKKGTVFATLQALDEDPVIYKYVREYLYKIEVLKEKGIYKIGNISFSTPVRHHHGVETYGLNIYGKKNSISFITDTRYFYGIEEFYKGKILILNVVGLEESNKIEHLSLNDAEKIICANKPKLAILTHFGITMIKAKPWILAEKLTDKIGVKVIAASDGLEIDLDKI
jgi:phosphoribosyl 1,2-cyclic phosphodiesterase